MNFEKIIGYILAGILVVALLGLALLVTGWIWLGVESVWNLILGGIA